MTDKKNNWYEAIHHPEDKAKLYNNWVSIVGFYLALFGLAGELFFLALDLFTGISTAYLGIIYIILLLQIVFGSFVVIYGMVRENRRRKAGLAPSIASELSIKRPIFVLFTGTVVVTGLTVIIGLGSYTVYHVTESNEFCGTTCHTVMNPEWVSYHNSAHARVNCVECHIGSGADWYVKSKLSGLRQVYNVMAGTYPKPIPTPIRDLRPARETCEECHWRRKNIGNKEKVKTYYLADEENTAHNIRLLMMIGGGRVENARSFGIHYHMLIEAEVEYIARDYKRQEIVWVRSKKDDGTVVEFNHADEPLTEDEKKTLEPRKMDCMDCHNRAAHRFPTPMESVNIAITEGNISRDLPYIKLKAVQALAKKFETKPKALVEIEKFLRNFYHEEHPEVVENQKEELDQAVESVKTIYSETIFPEMNSSWRGYPDNIGHKNWKGCFRCHNDLMQDNEGNTIFTTCNKCHLILAQGKDIGQINVNYETGIDFIHPGEEDPVEEFRNCVDCHLEVTDLY